jgi:hypothetical protein
LEEALVALREEHAATLRDLTSSHESALEQSKQERDVALESLKSDHTAALSEQQTAHQAILDELRSSHQKELEEHSSRAETLARELGDLKQSHVAVESDRDVVSKRCAELESQLSETAEAHRAETVRLQDELAQALERARDTSSRGEGYASKDDELRRALDSVSTLEKSLVLAQEERERLSSELQRLQSEQGDNVSKATHESTVKELENQRTRLLNLVEEAQQERDALRAERNKREAALRDSTTNGLGINGVATPTPSGLTRSTSQSSEHGDSVEAASNRSSPPLPHAPVPRQFANAAGNLNGASKAPPPTPPPSMPPPPLPVSAGMVSAPPSITSSTATTKSSGMTRTSSSSSIRRGSSEATSPPGTYVRSSMNSMTDSVGHQRMEEQETQVRGT